ncbi:MFS transporter [Tsukamurella sp. 8F]|uniref:MFS transporter n=1 Tax=unclassified Tsukamurella TaxID=2633480 RepID=UPI0023B8DBDF|nr:MULTISPECIES: MFS transporter [unclassified Tsukamurella]MDF0529362.1 MFS transporter [Tsukamurella sp. 8J]MDF0587131.1 MFS transporter [Tsukamurella sp. 8F]
MTEGATIARRTSWGPAILLCTTILLIPVGAPGASISIPGISNDLGASATTANWVMNAFMLSFAAVMAVAGSLADRIGRRRVLVIGLAVFVVGNLLIVTAPAIALVIAGRAIAGVGAAAITTGGSALLSATYSGPQRSAVFAVFGTTLGLGLAFGPTLSGLAITALSSWRALYLAYAVVAIPSLLLSPRLPDTPPQRSAAKFDLRGGALLTGALAAFMVGVSLGPDAGWNSPGVWVLLALAVAAGVAFARAERRTMNPLVDLHLLRVKQFRAVCLTVTLGAFGFVSLIFTLGLFFAATASVSALVAGAMLLPLTAPTLLVPLAMSKIAHRLPLGVLLPSSLAIIAIGGGWFAAIGPAHGLSTISWPMLLIGTGQGLALMVLDGAALAVAPAGREGMAAGVFNTVRLGTESIAVVVITAIIGTVTNARVGSGTAATLLAGHAAGGARGAAAYAAGWQAGLATVALLCALGAVVVWRELRVGPDVPTEKTSVPAV